MTGSALLDCARPTPLNLVEIHIHIQKPLKTQWEGLSALVCVWVQHPRTRADGVAAVQHRRRQEKRLGAGSRQHRPRRPRHLPRGRTACSPGSPARSKSCAAAGKTASATEATCSVQLRSPFPAPQRNNTLTAVNKLDTQCNTYTS